MALLVTWQGDNKGIKHALAVVDLTKEQDAKMVIVKKPLKRKFQGDSMVGEATPTSAQLSEHYTKKAKVASELAEHYAGIARLLKEDQEDAVKKGRQIWRSTARTGGETVIARKIDSMVLLRTNGLKTGHYGCFLGCGCFQIRFDVVALLLGVQMGVSGVLRPSLSFMDLLGLVFH